MRFFKGLFFLFIFLFNIFCNIALSEILKEIKISGNERIADETITMFSDVKVGDNLKTNDLNRVLKNLYATDFFDEVSTSFVNNILLIQIKEAPLIQNINITGVKADKYKDLIIKNLLLKEKSSYKDNLIKQEIENIESQFRNRGFYFTKVNVKIEKLENNLVNVIYEIDRGEKSKIAKISFIGDKIYKSKKLKSIIISEEYKFWKFISGKKYLQEELIQFDKRLLKNFYLNNGFYNAKINTSFAKIVGESEFELVFNIDPGEKILFGDLNLNLPPDFDETNFTELENLLKDLKDEAYSINSVEKILDEVNKITINEEFQTINVTPEEVIKDNYLNINFIINESEKYFVEKINIFGNNITQENVIRNQLEIDEGDPFSDLLLKKSENNIKSLNFFKNVKNETIDGKGENTKIVNINVEEKPTGEITAGAGTGTEGSTFTFGVKENNYLGRGISLNTNATISSDTFKGIFSVSNPNFNNSDKTMFTSFEASETDKLKDYGYKTTKNGFAVGTSFEYYDDFYLGLSSRNFFENIETDSTASALQQKQKGNYFDSLLKLDFNLDKRNQKFKTTDGFYSYYNVTLPIISDTNTFKNNYEYKVFSELFENNLSSFSFSLGSASSLTNDDVKLSERLFIPSRKLRGFESGKVGPKDGKDFIGGNFLTTVNLQSNVPMLFSNSENLDAIVFFDAANIWGVDYDSSIDDESKIRSSIGIGVDMLTPIGPLNFSLSQAISKKSTDIEESFRFNLGTTF